MGVVLEDEKAMDVGLQKEGKAGGGNIEIGRAHV